ncbi:MAG: DUF4859 domain-containing protein [Saprospiraceae bacterium]|nr:DUF4859 domain-containing protein [Saprospiraceae bacterium]
MNFQDLTANIGQYPDQCKNGDTFTIKQALVFHRTPNDSAQVTLVYHVNIKDNTVETIDQKNKHKLILFPNPTQGIITWNESNQWTLYNQLGVKKQIAEMDQMQILKLRNRNLFFCKLARMFLQY